MAKVASTAANDWEAQCTLWAKAGESFKIRGINAQHLAFCKGLCEKYNYKFTYDSSDKEFGGIFIPMNQAGTSPIGLGN